MVDLGPRIVADSHALELPTTSIEEVAEERIFAKTLSQSALLPKIVSEDGIGF